MEIKEIVCIGCPLGCPLEVFIDNEKVAEVKGYSCKRGVDYGIKECTNPTRILTTTVDVKDGEVKVVSVKTDKDIPKDFINLCMKKLKKVEAKAPIHIGDVIVTNILNTGSNIVATMDIDSKV